MTMPDDAMPSKRGPRRWGLFAPYIALLLAAVGWSLFWLVVRSQVEAGLKREAADLRASGYEASWKTLSVGGYPFRIEVEMTGPTFLEPYGWGVSAPRLTAIANAYQLTRWTFVAPEGLVLSRPGAGRVDVAGQALRASVSDLARAPRIAFEGEGVTFTPQSGSAPFAFTAAERIDLHLRAVDGDRAQLQAGLRGAQARRAGVFAQIAPLAPLTLNLTADLSHRDAFRGRDWAQSVRAWTDQGGAATVTQLLASVGEVSLSAKGGPLTVGPDGRLRGALDMSLRQGAAAIAALGAAQALDPSAAQSAAAVAQTRAREGGADLQLTFEAGATTLGPVRLGPAPRVY